MEQQAQQDQSSRDIELLDRCLTKIALADNDEGLQKVVSDVLGAVLNKLSQSSELETKKKAIEVLSTILGLVKQKKLPLPVEDLVESYRLANDSSRSFCLMFLQLALERISVAEVTLKWLPMLLVNLGGVALVHRNTLLRMLVDYLPHLPSSREMTMEAGWKDALADSKTRAVLVEWLLLLMLWPLVSESERKLVTLDDKRPLQWAGDAQQKAREGILRLLDAAELLPLPETFVIFLAGLGDPSTTVSERFQTSLARRQPDRESALLMAQPLVLLERANPVVSVTLREQMLAQLCKSRAVARPPLLGRALKAALGGLFGEEQKLRVRGVQVLRWLLQHVSPQDLQPFAPGVVAGLLQLVAKQPQIAAAEVLREGCYIVLGAVIRKCAGPFSSSLAIPSAIASSLQRETAFASVRDAMRGALFEMAPAFASVAPAEVFALVEKLSWSESPDVRAVACRFVRDCLPQSHAGGRCIALALSEDEHLTVSREARQALNPGGHYPPFPEMLAAVLERTKTEEPPAWHDQAIRFLWRCVEERPEQLLELPQDVQLAWDTFLWKAIQFGKVVSPLPSVACLHLLQTLRLNPLKWLAPTKDQWLSSRWSYAALQAYGGPTRSDARPLFANIAAIVHAALSPTEDQIRIAAMQTITSLIAFLEARNAPVERLAAAVHFAGLLASVHPDAQIASAPVWKLAVSFLQAPTGNDPPFIAACLKSLVEMSRRGCVPEEQVGATVSLACETLQGRSVKAERLVAESALEWLAALALGNNLSTEQKVQMVDAIFKVCPQSSHAEIPWISAETLSVLFSGWNVECATVPNWKWFDEAKHAKKSGGTESPDFVRQTLFRMFREPMSSGNVRQRECVAVWLCSLLRYCGSAMVKDLQYLQQACSILLADPSSLTRECASRGLLYAWRLGSEDDQSSLLNGLVKDFASQQQQGGGQQAKYDRTVFPDDALRIPKVSSSANSGSGSGNSNNNNNSNNSNNAAEGDGKESFRQLAGVAKPVDASLTPSLMSLASDPSVWMGGARAAAFSSDDNHLVRAAREQLLPHLPKIFPNLFKGQYHPDVYVAQSFRRILRVLSTAPAPAVVVPDQDSEAASKRQKGADLTLSELLNKFFAPTCLLVVNSARDRDWTSRDASLSCLADLLSGRSWEEVQENFGAFWMMVFAGMDDLRESVRESASHASSSLLSLTCRFVDTDHTPVLQAKEALRLVMEKLLEFGVASASKEVQIKSVLLLKSITKAAGPLMEPHCADVLEKLLHSASALEPEMLSYISQHTDKLEISKDMLHTMRSQMSRMTPLGECIDECLRCVDASNILQIVKSIESGLNGAGLPTLLQSTWAIATLARGAAIEVIKGKPATSLTLALFKIMGRQTENFAAFKELCAAVACVASFASSKVWSKKIIPHIVEGYFAGDDQSRLAAGVLLHALVNDNRSVETLRGNMKDCIGVVFVGKHDSDKKVQSEFLDVFVGIGAPSAVALYEQEILGLIQREISNTKSWIVRRQCYRALGMLANHLTNGDEMLVTITLTAEEAKKVQHWKGKGAMLSCLASLTSVWISKFRNSGSASDVVADVVSTLAQEMIRKGPTRTIKYKTRAAKSLVSVVREAFPFLQQESRLDIWKQHLWPSPLQQLLRFDKNDKQLISLQEHCFLVVAYAYEPGEQDQAVVDIVSEGITRQSSHEVRVAAVAALARLVATHPRWPPEEISKIVDLLFFCLGDKFMAVRERAASLVMHEDFSRLALGENAAWAAAVRKIDGHAETRAALEKLVKIFSGLQKQ